MKKIDPVYQKKIEQIKIDGEEYANSAMKGVYLEQSAALDELHALIGKAYINHSKDGLMVLNTTQQQQLTATMKAKLKAMGKELGQSEVDKVTAILAEVFSATYYKNAFVMESGMKANLKFNMIKKEFVDSAVNTEFKGEMFSSRIWANKGDLIDSLQSSLIKAMKGDMTIDKIGRDIRDRFNVTAYDSHRLVQTETARVQAQATDDIATSSGVTQQLFSATLDGKTNPEDASFDGNIYDVDDPSKPEIPLHPNCRCCYINIPYAGWSPTQRRDNATGEVIDYKAYDAWASDKGI